MLISGRATAKMQVFLLPNLKIENIFEGLYIYCYQFIYSDNTATMYFFPYLCSSKNFPVGSWFIFRTWYMANTQHHIINLVIPFQEEKRQNICYVICGIIWKYGNTHVLSDYMRKDYCLKLDSNKRSGRVRESCKMAL